MRSIVSTGPTNGATSNDGSMSDKKQMASEVIFREKNITKEFLNSNIHVGAEIEWNDCRGENSRFCCDQCQTYVCLICTTTPPIPSPTDAAGHYAACIHFVHDEYSPASQALRTQVDDPPNKTGIKAVEECVREAVFE